MTHLWRYRATDRDGFVCLFTHVPVPALYPDGGSGLVEDWSFEGWMKWSGDLVLPLDWQSSVVAL